ncbi:MAG TPA: low-specificity L-threonine aldolase [Candidatus Marinimicrobia bacterium]|nr:low-specificity L-threonine aldolase [Candidatus Neomarinimicrobiota bacterium]
MNKIIDLRSDTVTLPSDEMRQSIANADLGDDVFREDPTINQLESKSSELFGKEAAIFVPSGTMGNLASILAHCDRGTEIILGDKSHTFLYEGGGISAFGGIHSRQLPNQDDGTLDVEEIKSAIRTENDHFPKTSAIGLENTHNMCFGTPLSVEYINSVALIAKENGLKLHIDGARIFNAAVALNVAVKDLVENADSVTFCLSKGLAAPVGSVVCGGEKFIYQVRRNRKALGGGMRQAGILAAAGLLSLNLAESQLLEDHKNAKLLAEGIAQINGLTIDEKKVQTNIIYFGLNSPKLTGSQLVSKMDNRGIKFFEISSNRFRLVTHYGITRDDIEKTLEILDKMVN